MGIRLGILTRRRLCGEEWWGGLVLAEERPAWGALTWDLSVLKCWGIGFVSPNPYVQLSVAI